MNSSFLKKDWNLPGRGAHLTTSLKTFLLFVLTGFYILSVLIHLGYYPLNGDEPRRAIVAIEMRHSGNFISPTTLGWKYYNKPPLYNWIISACMFLTGSENEISVRLPSLVTILLWGTSKYCCHGRYCYCSCLENSVFHFGPIRLYDFHCCL